MKTMFIVITLLLGLAVSVNAQDSLDQSIDRLKTEIAKRETIDRDQSTPAAQRVSNRANLETARTVLLNAVQAKIAALEKYLNTLGDSITSAEKDDARTALRKLSTDANATLRQVDYPPVTPARPSVASPAESRVISNRATQQTTLKILKPEDKFSTDHEQVEVTVQVKPARANVTTLKATVENSGKQVEAKEFEIEQNEPVGTVTLALASGENTIKIELSDDADVNTTIIVILDDRRTPFTRAILGVEQAAAASAKPEQKLFLEFNLSAPLAQRKNPLRAPAWLWLNPRITSLPQQLSSSVAEFATASNFITPFNQGHVNEIVQGFEFVGGVELRASPLTGAFSSGFGKDTKVRYGLSLVLGGGMSTPFGSQQVAPQFFKVNSTVRDAFDIPADKEFIAFVSADRNRFFRQYFGGLRFKTFYVKKDSANEWEDLENIFPGVIDVTFGQNESVTGGSLHGGIARIDGIYPLPFIRGKYKGAIYAFGSAQMKLSKPKLPPPVILQPPESSPEFPSDKVFIQQVPPRDADHYRLGIGVDLIRLLKP